MLKENPNPFSPFPIRPISGLPSASDLRLTLKLDRNLSYEFEQHCGSCAGPPDVGQSSRGIHEAPTWVAQNEWYLISKTSSALTWSRANCASHSHSARSHVFALSWHFRSPLFWINSIFIVDHIKPIKIMGRTAITYSL